MASIGTIFFDVDGTLVDASKDIANAMNHVMTALGLKTLPKKKIMTYVGAGVKDLMRKCLGSGDEKQVEKASALYWEYFMAHAVDETVPYPHVREVLEGLKHKRKFILTNRYKDFAEATLKALGIIGYFEDIIGGDDENCLKPSACILDNITPRVKVDKESSLIVGDMAVDIMTGKNLGIKTCWVTYGLGKIEEVRDLMPDYVIDDMIELLEIVK